jgi:hypothetical protein
MTTPRQPNLLAFAHDIIMAHQFHTCIKQLIVTVTNFLAGRSQSLKRNMHQMCDSVMVLFITNRIKHSWPPIIDHQDKNTGQKLRRTTQPCMRRRCSPPAHYVHWQKTACPQAEVRDQFGYLVAMYSPGSKEPDHPSPLACGIVSVNADFW